MKIHSHSYTHPSDHAQRALTAAEKDAIRANAAGEHVYCGDYASALQIARDACDRSEEWSADADELAAEIARKAWDSTRA